MANGGYRVARLTEEILWISKPNGADLPVPLEWLDELRGLLAEGRITLDDVRRGKVFERVPDTRMEKYIINGYKNVFARLLA